ncbi:hypothetical protein ASG87_06080 [Frateuria sp. Soil773]|nr:hypothetical protein ASG87_06080 [Frateuria sp. Soil773]
MPRRPGRAAIAALPLLLAACASLPNGACGPGMHGAVRDELYFGTAMPQGQVSPGDWDRFLRDTVTPRFPQGLTVSAASGQWRGADGGIVREPAYAVTLVHPDDDASEQAVRAIAGAYKARFAQEAVLRVRSPACASF